MNSSHPFVLKLSEIDIGYIRALIVQRIDIVKSFVSKIF